MEWKEKSPSQSARGYSTLTSTGRLAAPVRLQSRFLAWRWETETLEAASKIRVCSNLSSFSGLRGFQTHSGESAGVCARSCTASPAELTDELEFGFLPALCAEG